MSDVSDPAVCLDDDVDYVLESMEDVACDVEAALGGLTLLARLVPALAGGDGATVLDLVLRRLYLALVHLPETDQARRDRELRSLIPGPGR